MTKPRHVVIGTPMKGEPLDVYTQSVQNFVQSCDPAEFTFSWLKYKSGLVKARDSICAHALHAKADEVLMWDSDTTATPDEVRRLLSHDVDIVGAAYTTKDHPARWVYTPLQGATYEPGKLLEVLECGTGLKRYRVSALERMMKAHPHLAYEAADRALPPDAVRFNWHFMGVVNRRWLSEDFGFDYLARKAGLKVWLDPQVIAQHWGMVPFPLLPPPMPGIDKPPVKSE